MAEPLRVCLILYHFPLASQTFIARLVDALMDDPELELHLLVLGRYNPDALDMLRTSPQLIEQRVVSAPPVRFGGPLLYLSRLRLILSCLVRAPLLTLRCLNVRRFGRRAFRLHPLRLAFGIRSLPPMDVYHAQFFSFGPDLVAAAEAGLLGNGLVACSVRGADVSVRGAVAPQLPKRLARHGVRLLPVAESLAVLLREMEYPADLIQVVPSGIPVQDMPFVNAYGAKPRHADTTGRRYRLLFIGRLVPKKGLELAVRALAEVLRDGRDCRLTVLGDGPDAASAHALAHELGCGERVSFRGTVGFTEVQSELAAADLLLVPSRRGADGNMEGIPNVVKEAMAAGTVVVASDHSGTPEIVEDGRTGFLFAENNQDALDAALRRAFAQQADWATVAAAARERVEREHGIPAMTAALKAVYRQARMRTLWEPGDELPGLGRVREVRSLVSRRDKLLGRYHRDTGMGLLTMEDGRILKAVLDTQGTRRVAGAVAHLQLMSARVRVPAVLYHDAARLVLEFVEGSPLHGSALGPELTHTLAEYLAAAQAPETEEKPLGLDELAAALPGFAGQALRFPAAPPAAPQALCFSDAALKNYVLTPAGEPVYIDAFGILRKPLGTVFVKQLLRIPAQLRPLFFERFVTASPCGAHVREHLGFYTAWYLLDRALTRDPMLNAAEDEGKTWYRRRHRRRVAGEARDRLIGFLGGTAAGADEPAAYLMQIEGNS